jgi:hypothetical protein
MLITVQHRAYVVFLKHQQLRLQQSALLARLSRPTLARRCNYTGPTDPASTVGWGVIDFDWSNWKGTGVDNCHTHSWGSCAQFSAHGAPVEAERVTRHTLSLHALRNASHTCASSSFPQIMLNVIAVQSLQTPLRTYIRARSFRPHLRTHLAMYHHTRGWADGWMQTLCRDRHVRRVGQEVSDGL